MGVEVPPRMWQGGAKCGAMGTAFCGLGVEENQNGGLTTLLTSLFYDMPVHGKGHTCPTYKESAMYTIYLLTIVESHKFDNVCHTSAHPSYDAAQTYADTTALPQARLRDTAEWTRYFLGICCP